MWYTYVCMNEATHGIHLYVHVLFIILFVGKCDLYENHSISQRPLCVQNIWHRLRFYNLIFTNWQKVAEECQHREWKHRSGVNKCFWPLCSQPSAGEEGGKPAKWVRVCMCVSFTEGVCFINCRCRCRCHCLCRCSCCWLWCRCLSQSLPLPILMLMLMPQQPLPPQQPCRASKSKRNIPATHACGYTFFSFLLFSCLCASGSRSVHKRGISLMKTDSSAINVRALQTSGNTFKYNAIPFSTPQPLVLSVQPMAASCYCCPQATAHAPVLLLFWFSLCCWSSFAVSCFCCCCCCCAALVVPADDLMTGIQNTTTAWKLHTMRCFRWLPFNAKYIHVRSAWNEKPATATHQQLQTMWMGEVGVARELDQALSWHGMCKWRLKLKN